LRKPALSLSIQDLRSGAGTGSGANAGPDAATGGADTAEDAGIGADWDSASGVEVVTVGGFFLKKLNIL
jgi:hypothetical protein